MPPRCAPLLLGLLLLACGRRSEAPPEPVTPDAEIAVHIDSHSWSDVVISLSRDGAWYRVGLARAANVSIFTVPWRYVGASGVVRLRADPVGSAKAIVTDQLSVRPGSVILWTLESDLTRSTLIQY